MRYLKLLPFMMSISLFASDEVKTPSFKQYDNRVVVFPPFYQSYERIKVESLYVGVEAFLARCNKKPTLLEAEFRMGYNLFLNQKDHVTPFGGVGYVQELWDAGGFIWPRHKPGIAYVTGGFLYTHEFTSVFNMGVNGKILMGMPMRENHFNWGSYVIGSQVSFPFTFRFGHRRQWDFRLEPFNLFLRGTKSTRCYSGSLISFGYRF